MGRIQLDRGAVTPDQYRTEREKRGTQSSVAALLCVDPQTISRRERGEIEITREAELALLSLQKSRRARRPQKIALTEEAARDASDLMNLVGAMKARARNRRAQNVQAEPRPL